MYILEHCTDTDIDLGLHSLHVETQPGDFIDVDEFIAQVETDKVCCFAKLRYFIPSNKNGFIAYSKIRLKCKSICR